MLIIFQRSCTFSQPCFCIFLINILQGGKQCKISLEYCQQLCQKCIFLINFQIFVVEEKDRNIHLNYEFPLKIAKFSLQWDSQIPHFFHAWTLTGILLNVGVDEMTISSSFPGDMSKVKNSQNSKFEDVQKEKDQAIEDMASVEVAFSDLHRRYEKLKQVVESLKKVGIAPC